MSSCRFFQSESPSPITFRPDGTTNHNLDPEGFAELRSTQRMQVSNPHSILTVHLIRWWAVDADLKLLAQGTGLQQRFESLNNKPYGASHPQPRFSSLSKQILRPRCLKLPSRPVQISQQPSPLPQQHCQRMRATRHTAPKRMCSIAQSRASAWAGISGSSSW